MHVYKYVLYTHTHTEICIHMSQIMCEHTYEHFYVHDKDIVNSSKHFFIDGSGEIVENMCLLN